MIGHKLAEVLIVSWNDNRPVTILSTVDPILPMNQAMRWPKEARKKVPIPQPHMIGAYNTFMGSYLNTSYLETNAVAPSHFQYDSMVSIIAWCQPIQDRTVEFTMAEQGTFVRSATLVSV
uniref:Uncharacterized protein n=1 Tax=Ditylenchus dipsaci TaxID=166011 RepID=A0A915DS71_9BILA